MSIKSILLLDECSCNNNTSILNDSTNLVIFFNNVDIMESYPFINISSQIKRKCLCKSTKLNNEIHVLHNNIYNYKIELLPLKCNHKLPIIYINENKVHIFITSYNDNVDRKDQSNTLNTYIESLNIPKIHSIIICGYFGYDFYTKPEIIASLSTELYSHIPQIYEDKNNTKLNRYIFIRKYASRKTIELNYVNNVCIYNI